MNQIHLKILKNSTDSINIDNNEGKNEENNWNIQNEQTINNWKNNFEEMSYVYELTLQKYKTKINIISMIAFIISSLQTTLTFSNLGINEEENPDITLIVKILLIVLALVVNISNGIIKIYKWNDIVESYKGYTEKLQSFSTILISETELPKELRKNALDFIIQHKASYIEILRSSPDICKKEYMIGLKEYNNYIKNDKINENTIICEDDKV